MLDFLILCLEFFKTGLFAIGGGLATIPFLYEMIENHNWFTQTDLTNMIAIAESTPGPLGINIATYAGYNSMGILGGIFATLSLVLPSYIVIVIIAKILDKFRTNKYVNNSFNVLRPVVAALILSASFEIFKLTLFKLSDDFKISDFSSLISIFNLPNIIVFITIFVLIKVFNKHPIIYIFIGALCGIFLKGFIS